MIKLINQKNRAVLCEGRNWGMGFAFCKKIANNTYETIQPISTCKDYLNDVIYNEITGKNISAHGLRLMEPSNIFLPRKKVYLAMSILNTKGDRVPYNRYGFTYENDQKLLNANYKHMESLINYIEDCFGIKTKTIIDKVEDNLYIVKFSKAWVATTYTISLYTLILRMSLGYSGEDIKEYLANPKVEQGDKQSWVSIYKLFDYFCKNFNLVQQLPKDFEKLSNMTIHNAGIKTYIYINKLNSMNYQSLTVV